MTKLRRTGSRFGQGVGSGRLGVGVGWPRRSASGSEGGGVFPETTLDFLDSLQTRPDPVRPLSDPDLGAQFSYPIPPVRPPFGPTPHWRVLTRRVGRFHILSHHIARIKGDYSDHGGSSSPGKVRNFGDLGLCDRVHSLGNRCIENRLRLCSDV